MIDAQGWVLIIGAVFTGLTTLFAMFIAWRTQQIHTNTNSTLTESKATNAALRATIEKQQAQMLSDSQAREAIQRPEGHDAT